MSHQSNSTNKAIISIDVDCTHGHIEDHSGKRRMRARDNRFIDISYQYWLPRYLDLLEELQIQSTFFLVADFARHPGNKPLIQRIVAQGHEVASHSLTHCIELCSLSREVKEKEIKESKKILEDLTGLPVKGYRGAGYAFDRDISELLLENEYIYDSSVVPGYLFKLYKRVMWTYDKIFSGDAIVYPNSPPQIKKHPYIIKQIHERRLVEIPLNVLPIFPYPFISYVITSERRFQNMYRLVKSYSHVIVHAVHDFEFMECQDPSEYVKTRAIDTIARLNLRERYNLHKTMLSTFKQDCEIITAREFAERFLGKL